MLQPFPIEDVLWPGFFLLICGFLISLYITRRVVISAFIALFKSLFFVIYFSVFFNGQYTFSDDWTYIYAAKKALQSYGFIGLFTEHLFELQDIFTNSHFVYQLFNITAFELFGVNYFSPVALNILLTYFCGYVLRSLAVNFGLSPNKAIALYIFFILHPDLIFWSSIPNLKDTMVMFLTISMLYIISLQISKTIKVKHYIAFVLIIIVFSFLRFYLPYFILFSYLIFSFIRRLSWKLSPKNIGLISGFIFCVLGAALFVGTNAKYLEYIRIYLGDFTNPVLGVFRYFMTPIPFHTVPAYNFLLLPSLFHWCLLFILILGVRISFKINKSVSGFLLVYFLCLLLFYGSYSELQGPRHRVQLTPLIAFYQFLGLWYMLKTLVKKEAGNDVITT